jgi:cytochrome c biogenesis protein CcmG/thiol:disulfide interchange protein DsbE
MTGLITGRRLLLLAPLVVVIGAGAAFYAMLRGMQSGEFDPRSVPSQLIDKPVPAFSVPGLSSADLAAGHAVVVNFFASWCEPCQEEAAELMALRAAGVPLIGIAYKDKPADTRGFLDRNGDPYVRLGTDEPGLVGIDWGITGVPETYLIDGHGVVRWRYVGPLTPEVAEQALLPLLHRTA